MSVHQRSLRSVGSVPGEQLGPDLLTPAVIRQVLAPLLQYIRALREDDPAAFAHCIIDSTLVQGRQSPSPSSFSRKRLPALIHISVVFLVDGYLSSLLLCATPTEASGYRNTYTHSIWMS